MRIQHNIAALNSYRNLTNNNSAVAKNLEKLSSGYRINRAGDDAAGLAISEKMRAQITGLETAQKNAQDGISLVQTAEGALTEVHSMLNRMVELADQSANGTYDNEVDRTNLQKEIDSLKSEIDRISKATNFNGIKLLDGSIGEAKGLSTGMTDAVEGTALKNAFTTTTTGVDGKLTLGKAAVAAKDEFYMPDTLQVSHNKDGGTAGTLSFELEAEGGKKVTVKLTGNTTANGQTSTFTMDEIVDALNDTTATTGTAIALGDGRTITLTETGTGSLADIQANYEFSFKDNKLVSTAKNAGANYSMTMSIVTGTGGENGDGTEDLDAMTKTLENDLDEDGNGDAIALGAKTSASVAGKEAADNKYTVGSIKVTLDDEDNLHGSALKVGDKTYILQKEGQDLDEALAELADNDSNIEIVKFADGEAMSELMNAINANKGETNLQAVEDNGAIQISETEAYGNKILAGAEGAASIDMSEAVGSATLTIGAEEASKNVSVSADLTEGSQVTIGKKTYQFLTKPEDAVDGKIGIQFTAGDAQANAQALLDAIKANDSSLADTAKLDANGPSVILGSNTVAADASSKGLTLQVGDTSDSYQKVSVVVKSTSTASLGIDGIDISTQEGASAAIDKIKDAINSVSSTRGDLGAIQNRLEHTINNLGVTTENITAAESRIRDVDMAKEMMAYTKNNILVQASQAMLAQANQVPQGVLQLLG